MALALPNYTIEDLDRFPSDGNRYELLDGVLLVTPAPNLAHQLVGSRLHVTLANALQGKGIVMGPGVVIEKPKTQLEPDVLVFPSSAEIPAHWTDVSEHWLAIEVLSPSSRRYDRVLKRDAYLALGVREVWIVDPRTKKVEVCRQPGPGIIERDAIVWTIPHDGGTVTVNLSEIFAGL